jgi:hypothetical protein
MQLDRNFAVASLRFQYPSQSNEIVADSRFSCSPIRLFENLERKAFLQPDSCCRNQAAQGARHASLPAYHLAQVARRHTQFQYRGVAIDLAYRDCIGLIDERFRDLLDQRSHVPTRLTHA